jgi:hypothetical protein
MADSSNLNLEQKQCVMADSSNLNLEQKQCVMADSSILNLEQKQIYSVGIRYNEKRSMQQLRN